MAAVVYLVKDLMFSGKIREVASQVGVDVSGVRDAKLLPEAARGAKLVILDLRLPDALQALDLLAADPETRAVRSVGFIDHERTDVMEAAGARGCGSVLAKGRFSTELPSLLAELT